MKALRAHRRARRSCASSARGAAAVEFALIMPVLFVIVFGVISYGAMLSFRQSVSQAAAEGARAAAVTQTGTSADSITAAKSAISQALAGGNITCTGTNLMKAGTDVGDCAVSLAACPQTPSRQCATVTVTYAYRDHPVVPGFIVPLPSTLSFTSSVEVN